MKGVLVPIMLFLCVTYGFRLLVDAVVRVLTLKSGASDDAVRLLIRDAREGRWLGALHLAFNIIGLAVPAMLWPDPWPSEPSLRLLATLALGLGLANLGYAYIAHRTSKQPMT
ncbi:hypothetical protein C7S18_21900 [Ahniella affigens]|uniref:Uncharacterized protein n=1 Tax=Ahniella affigens TaxID=2021234 RepID=A0A2P1PXY2_9GAMM|nr:hypothetical protein [Ahniella affigens]AVP99664.1 hypothetical protein C7S18_21900 [Ahniella affigens]